MRRIHPDLVAAIALASGMIVTMARAHADEPPAVFAIEGSIVDSNGQPVPDVNVLLLRNDWERQTTRVEKHSPVDASGRFHFESIPQIPEAMPAKGSYFLCAFKGAVPVACQGLYSGTVFPVALQADIREPSTVTGIVRGPDGTPEPGVSVWVELILGDRRPENRGRNYVFAANSGIESFQTTTDVAGGFEFRNLPKGMDIRFHVEHAAFARQKMTCTAPSAVTIKLEPGSVIHGQVLYGDTNQPASRVRVGVEEKRDSGAGMPERAHVFTDESGKYKIASLKPGKYNVWADQEGWTIQAQEGYELRAGDANPALYLNLIRGGFIKGRIVDEQGRPVNPGARSNIQWRGPSRPRTGLTSQFAAINPDGTFHFRAAPGENWLGFVLTGEWKSVTGGGPIVKVAEGETVEIRYVVKPK